MSTPGMSTSGGLAKGVVLRRAVLRRVRHGGDITASDRFKSGMVTTGIVPRLTGHGMDKSGTRSLFPRPCLTRPFVRPSAPPPPREARPRDCGITVRSFVRSPPHTRSSVPRLQTFSGRCLFDVLVGCVVFT